MNKLAIVAFFALFAISASEVLRTFPRHIDASVVCETHPLCQYTGYGNWRHLGRAQADQEHSVVFAVKLADNADQTCDSILTRISTPGSPVYGKHLSLEEVWKLTSNRRASRVVLEYLSQFDLTSVDAGVTSDFIKVKAPVSVLENMFHTQLHKFQHASGKTIVRAASYSLPKEVAEHVDTIVGLVTVPNMENKMTITSAGADGSVTPALLQSFYNINVMKSSKKSSMSTFEALGQDYSPTDLKAFQQQFDIPVAAVDKVIGTNSPSVCTFDPNSCAEANLDVQYIMAIAAGANMTYWSIDENSMDPFYDWIISLSQDPKPPMVHSISYGSLGPEDPANDVKRFNTEVCKLGLRGVTVVVASGDDGVANFEAREDKSACGFTPSFPATSPYVVAVGATSGPEVGQKEVACSSADGNIITTGGGFSYWFSRPSYQDSVVSNYLKNGPKVPPISQFNSTGRGYPDVALAGANYQVIIGGSQYGLYGTSASTPVFAAMLTLINDMRIGAGKSPVGFVTPALYSIGAQAGQKVFNDIVDGDNNCCAGQKGGIVCCRYGFTATTGWDPLTGLGSVNFKNLADALMNM